MQISRLALLVALVIPSLTAQERQVSFDTKGTILEIKKASAYAVVWTAEVGDFERLIAFQTDSVVTIEVYRTVDGVIIRSRTVLDRPTFAAKQTQLDSMIVAVERKGGELSDEEIEDLRSTFTYDQTGFSSFHGLTAGVLTESGSMFWIVTGGSYFVISTLSDNMDVTRANVEAAKYGHLTGIGQGFAAAIMADAEEKATFGLASVGGIAHAVVSYRNMTGSDVEPTPRYLRMTAERHSLVWGWGLGLLFSGDDPDATTLAATSLAMSLTSNIWSSPLFGFERRRMNWADALIADEFMTPWYLSLLALSVTLELDKPAQGGLIMSVGGVAGYFAGVHFNEGRMRSIGTVRRTRLLTYGGALLGLGLVAAAEADAKASLWIISGSTWLGYVVGGRFGTREPSTGWDLRVMPENILVGQLLRPTASRPLLKPVPVAVLSVNL